MVATCCTLSLLWMFELTLAKDEDFSVIILYSLYKITTAGESTF